MSIVSSMNTVREILSDGRYAFGFVDLAYRKLVSLMFMGAACFVSAEDDSPIIDKQHAVIMQYHHVSSSTPHSTSISTELFTQHMEWLENNGFEVVSLATLVDTLKSGGKFDSDKVVAITFDDNYRSICDTAWPILRDKKFPFTVFVNTARVSETSTYLCSWDDLRDIYQSGLMIVGNHSVNHPHMLDFDGFESSTRWRERIINEVVDAQAVIDREMGKQPRFFAYPYGEYNEMVEGIIRQLGYIGFGQQSGGVGSGSNFAALPRFPLSGSYSNLETMAVKMMALALPVDDVGSTPNPIFYSSSNNPPQLAIHFSQKFNHPLNCFLGTTGQPIKIKRTEYSLVTQNTAAFNVGRGRYNCTAPSGVEGRYYWYSHQWQVKSGSVDEYLRQQWFDFSHSLRH
ncbi:Poly-beta-1,6-N-acetyl-D-glucosamine N-deacetylase [BD1-7 clade bacterium]|uniref:Poly-beta-1,6-N-acetyl-D-glucosamine N-deacetylase n=1 Tax=BD1-7 clade bacterium TaxID=2029982 RepID=A0A5S9NKW0_9GAMM|nr:Poly-beta-1,6-N-acetyl-D-glucosamine N-deacetylase [BD1-7 clade bacterium]CAA0093200.1 Poly-beta-1,6-N-acetyl-D-glucosamine N-deacetylase [BD1-7 clade bacterium]